MNSCRFYFRIPPGSLLTSWEDPGGPEKGFQPTPTALSPEGCEGVTADEDVSEVGRQEGPVGPAVSLILPCRAE